MLRSISINSPWSRSGRRKGRLRWEGFADEEMVISLSQDVREGVVWTGSPFLTRVNGINIQE